jgi:pimeloyl-ACP methyl ester carboxylesterase
VAKRRLPKLLTSTARPGSPFKADRAGDDYGAHAEPDWRDVDWRPHLRQLDIDGEQVNLVDYGEGSPDLHPVVFVHGLGGCWQNWLENVPRIAAEGRRAIALDLPGFGFSEMPDEKISISGYGRLVNAVCDELDLGEVVLVGNSMGGFTAAETAIQYPERVSRMVLNSAAGLTTSDIVHGPVLAGARIAAALGARTAAMSEKVVVRKRLRWPVYYTFIRYPHRIPTDLLYEITRGSGRPGFLPALRAIFDYDFRDRLPDIRCPTLVIWGEDDMLVPKHDADEYARLIPNARKVVLEDTGHSAMIERPQTFNDLVVDWLDELADAPRREEDMGAANTRGPAADADRGGASNGAAGGGNGAAASGTGAAAANGAAADDAAGAGSETAGEGSSEPDPTVS